MSNIKVGDLVVVVRATPCCGNTEGLGTIFRVTGEGSANYCFACCHDFNEPSVAGLWLHIRASRLKRIHPLDELESEQTREPHSETA